MRDPERIEKVLAAVRVAWATHPDLRLGQLIDNMATDYTHGRLDVFYIEDEILLERLKRYAAS